MLLAYNLYKNIYNIYTVMELLVDGLVSHSANANQADSHENSSEEKQIDKDNVVPQCFLVDANKHEIGVQHQCAFQDTVDVCDAVARTSSGQPYAYKWPKSYKWIVPDLSRAQSLEDAFEWSAKARLNLEDLKKGLKQDEMPALVSGKCFTVSSNFSGICSQSRGSKIIEQHGFGCSFQHVSP